MKVSSTDMQNSFGKYLKFAEAGEEIIVTKNGNEIAKLVRSDEADMLKESTARYAAREEWVSYEQFLELTEGSEHRYELIDGIVYHLSSPSYKHQYVVSKLLVAFHHKYAGKGCTPLTSPFDITLKKDETNICVVQPDIVVICDTANRNDRDRYIGVPALVVEVVSPSSRSKDLIKKMELYKSTGIQEYWIVDPDHEQIHVYRFEDLELANARTFDGRADDEVCSFYETELSIAMRDLFETP
ncbi:MAG: prevent-host-death family protein [Paenibacillus sp.]|nr:prevent-host-death family protein [Paenibacillus sp.]